MTYREVINGLVKQAFEQGRRMTEGELKEALTAMNKHPTDTLAKILLHIVNGWVESGKTYYDLSGLLTCIGFSEAVKKLEDCGFIFIDNMLYDGWLSFAAYSEYMELDWIYGLDGSSVEARIVVPNRFYKDGEPCEMFKRCIWLDALNTFPVATGKADIADISYTERKRTNRRKKRLFDVKIVLKERNEA